MGAALELLALLLSRVAAITGLVQLLASAVQAIQNYLNPPTGISQITAIQNLVEVVKFDVADSTYSLLAIKTELDALQASVTALGSPQQATNPVILPTTPPTGYGGGGTASEVWAYTMGDGSIPASELQLAAGVFVNQIENPQANLPMVFAPGWSVGGLWGDSAEAQPSANFLTLFSPSTILVTDANVGAWLDRVYAGHGSSYDALGRPYIMQAGTGWTWTYYVGDLEFAEYKAAAFGAPAVITGIPPVWPGAANVTLGTPVAIESTNVISALMHGVLIEIDTVPVGRQTYIFDDYTSYGHIGQVAFQQDSGWSELPQNLGFDNAIYSPKEMQEANHVRWRIFPGVTGFVTPWTINP